MNSQSSRPSVEANGVPQDHVGLTREPLDIGAISQLVVDPKCGAVATFTGTTRDNFEGRTVIKLEYEAYEEMAVDEMKRLCLTVRENFSDVGHLAIYHRLGLVPVSEASVVIAVSSPHRKTALEACAFAIDALKASVPVWKKELYDDGSSQWKENCECAWSQSTNPS